MRQAKDEADQANSAKSAFLAVVSHEIRTPMTGIMGMVKLLRDSNLTKEQKEYTQTIQDSSDAMLALLNDILDFEKIEQGKMPLENISFDLHRLINGVKTLMSGHASQKNIGLEVKIGENLPKYIYGDPTRLRQVLLNLTGNAVKFTEEGKVTITAEAIDEKVGEKNCEIYFSVTDSGVGISKEAQANLFKPFSQADSSISRKFGGTGLGLAISKGLVETMGSTININSNEGEGSTFFFTLNMPLGDSDQASKKSIDKADTATAKKMKILVVDDNEINRKVVNGFLEKTDHSLTMLEKAEEAIELLESEIFDLILMDIELPGLKGDEATLKIRESNNDFIRHTPIIALTGNTMPNDIDRFYKAGMNGFIAKPIDVDILKTAINKAGQGVFDNPVDKNFKAAKPEKKKPKATFTAETKVTQNEKKEKTPAKKKKVIKKDKQVLNQSTLDTLKEHISNEDIQEMLNDVISKSDEIIGDMLTALKNGENKTLSQKAHELRGMTGNFGLEELSHHASVVEAKAKTEAHIILTGLVDPLPEIQKRAKEALNQWMDKA